MTIKMSGLLPSPQGATRVLEDTLDRGLRLLSSGSDEAGTAREALLRMRSQAKDNLIAYVWSELADLIVRVGNEKLELALEAEKDRVEDGEDDEDEKSDARLTFSAPMPFNINVTLDDEAALVLNTLVAAGAKTNAEVIGHALKFYLAALKHHAKQLDELNESEDDGWDDAEEA